MGRNSNSLQHELLRKVLPDIENNKTSTAYKRHIKNFAKWAKGNGYKKPETTEKMETYVFEPPETVQTYIYHCDSQFFIDPLKQIIEYKEVYGAVVLDRKEATIAASWGIKDIK